MIDVNFGLSAPSEKAAKDAAKEVLKYDPSFTLLDEESNWYQITSRHAFDPIGTIYKNDGEYDAEGKLIKPPIKEPGWFANLLVESSIAENVEILLNTVGAPFGVKIVKNTGRQWAL